jgi:hypothetical protein
MPIRDILEKLVPESDKLQHFFIGSFLTFNFILFSGWISLIINFAGVLGYEFYQRKTKTGQFEIKDAFYGWLSSLIVASIILIRQWVHSPIIL